MCFMQNLKSEMNFEVAELKVFVSILSDWLNGEMSDLDTAGLYLVQTAAYSIKLFARVFGKYEQDCFGVALNRCVTLVGHLKASSAFSTPQLVLFHENWLGMGI